jgi:hypothetical protein
MSPEQIRLLLRQRGKVQMPQGYTQTLLESLRERQRMELLKQPVWRIAVDRLGTFLSEHSLSTPRYAFCLAVFVALGLGVIALLRPNTGSVSMAKQDKVPRSEDALRPGVEARHVSFEK